MQFHHPNRMTNYTFAAQQRAFPPPPLLANSRWRGGNARSLRNICVPHHLYWQTAVGRGYPNHYEPRKRFVLSTGKTQIFYSSNLRFPKEAQVQLLSTQASPPGTSTASVAELLGSAAVQIPVRTA